MPLGFELLFPDIYNEVKNDGLRGNFLTVVGREMSDKKLSSLIVKHFSKGIY